MIKKILPFAIVLGLSACAQMNVGDSSAKTSASGSAGGATAQNENRKLEKCSAPLGTIAVIEDTNAPWYGILTGQYNLGSTTPVLKLMIQQSNCFVVVDRGRAMANVMQERALEQSGELRKGSNFGKGQIVSADYSLSPSITFANNNAGGLGSAIGGILGPTAGFLAGSVSAKEASVMLTMSDNRSGVQLAAAEGSAKNWDLGIAGGLFGGGAAGVAGGYANTAQGKVIVAAFMDAYNNIVQAARNYKEQDLSSNGAGKGGKLQAQGAASARANGSQEMSLYDAQVKLNELGFHVGKPDGMMGRNTAAQLRKFQMSRGITQTGRLDADTAAELSKGN